MVDWKNKIEVKAYMKAYNQRPEAKAYKKAYNQRPEAKAYKKAYNQRPEAKAYMKAYYQRPEVKAYMKAYNQTHVSYGKFIADFFKELKRNKAWKREGIEKMASLFSKTVCDLTDKQQCELEEKILQETEPEKEAKK